jgi:hypothetical protein
MRRHLLVIVLIASVHSAPLGQTTRAATAFADPGFEQAWQAGEAVVPNFWGPLANARDGMTEQYEYQNPQLPHGRLVQYFDKGRMERNPSEERFPEAPITFTGGVNEMISGQMVLGTATNGFFCTIPAIAIAGDDDPRNPTYASVASQRKGQLANTADQTGGYPTNFYDASGNLKTSDPLLPLFQFTTYDALGHHNIPKVFAEYRDQVSHFQPAGLAGLTDPVQRAGAGANILGAAMSEPFMEMVYVNGVQLPIIIQLFAGRILTYNAANPEPFKVEMNNAGQHYYRWRYGSPGPNCH